MEAERAEGAAAALACHQRCAPFSKLAPLHVMIYKTAEYRPTGGAAIYAYGRLVAEVGGIVLEPTSILDGALTTDVHSPNTTAVPYSA